MNEGTQMSQASRRNLWIAAAVVAAIAVLVAGAFGYRAFADRKVAASKVQEATVLIEQADVAVVQIDDVVSQEVTPELADSARDASDTVSTAVTDLEEAVRLLDSAAASLPEAERGQASLLKSAAQARLEMLEHAPAILQYNIKSAEALPLAEQAWEHTIQAVKYSEQAVAAYNKLDKAGVEKSAKIIKQAASELASATALFNQAHEAFPEAKLDVFGTYVASREKLAKLSQDSDTAWLAGDLVKANSIINTYNDEDKKVIALAKKLPPNPRQAIAAAYDQASATPTDLYYEAREKATQADERLRDF